MLAAAIRLASWEQVGREDLRRLLRSGSPLEALEILEREVPRGKPDGSAVEEMLRTASGLKVGHAIYGDVSYPEILRNIPDPPVVLFHRGDLPSFLKMPAVAVIGSRSCTRYGRNVARDLAAEFARNGVAVVSGMARGIDGEAHMGTLDAGGFTMAVLGSGIDVCYPPEHEKLADRIAGSGVLVTEYPPGTRPARYRFPERNRLISGFSRGVVVVEAGKRSGTMITVNTALDQGRDVFAVPGQVTGALSMGTNMLLRDGAGVVITARDVLEPLGITVREPGTRTDFVPENEVEKAVLEHLTSQPVHFDELLRLVGVGTAVLQTGLLNLEMAGVVRQHPGKLFSLR